MANSLIKPLAHNVPITDDKGNPTPYFQRFLQILLQEKNSTADDLTVTESSVATLQTDLSALETTVSGLELDDLADVDTTGVADGDVLTYNSGTWEPGTSGGGGGSSSEAPLVTPLVADFTLENAGTASMSDTSGGLLLTVPSSASNIRFVRDNSTLPTPPYSITVRAKPGHLTGSASLYNMCLIARNSSNGRIIIYGDYNGGQHLVQRWSGYSSFSANAFGPTSMYWLPVMPWMKMTNDGTNLLFYRSPDGYNWTLVHSEPLATYLTAAGGSCDQIGFGTWQNSVSATAIFSSYELV